jgi:hypothetical protein
MSSKEQNLKDDMLRTLHSHEESTLEKIPNLNPESYSLLFYLVLGSDLSKGMYFGLTFPLEDSAHIEELRALSNKYIEFKDGVVKMGVLKLENLEIILRAPYIKPSSVRIL